MSLTPRRTFRHGGEVLVQMLLYPGIQPLDLVGPHEVFVGANRWCAARGDEPPYEIELVGGVDRGTAVVAESGLAIVPSAALTTASTRPHTLLIPGGDGIDAVCADEVVRDWTARQAAVADRVVSVCSGALLLATAGLLDGRRATTHWRRADQLRREHPRVAVEVDPIFVRDGDVWTSAGVTAGIDLALALVEDDLGARVAQTIAQQLVLFLRRPGGQSQFAAPVWSASSDHDGVRRAQALIHEDPAADLPVRRLAESAGMSERHFTRMFTDQVGCPPGRYVERVRVEAARRVLETGDDGLAAVARRCGFGTAETFRRAFLRQVGVTPGAYRQRFALHRHRPDQHRDERVVS